MKFVLGLLLVLNVTGFSAVSRNEKHVQEYVWDYTVSGGSSAAAIELSAISGKDDLPTGAIVEKVSWKVVTALSSSTNASVTVGNGDDSDGYMVAAAYATLGSNVVSNTYQSGGALLWDDTNDAPKALYIDDATTGNLKIAFNTDVTAGKILFFVEYFMPSL